MPHFNFSNPFTKPFDFARQRTAFEAIGFYVAHLLLYMIVAGVAVGFLMAPMLAEHGASVLDANNPQMKHMAEQMGMPLNAAYALAMTYLMLKAKNVSHKDVRRMAVGIGALLLGFLSPVLGLIAIAYLSTRPVVQTPVA